ncbi:MAG: VOC family protein, partial [Minisyncoccia bacterium]
VYNGKNSSAWATNEGLGFWIRQAKRTKQKYSLGAPGLHHICFKVKSARKGDALYAYSLKGNIHIFDAPKAYPEYTKNYYAVFLADPDGIKIEVARYS